MSVSSGNYLSSVRAQYEQLPYPKRDPENEKQHLLRTVGDDLEYLNHFGFSGKMPMEDFRVLDAGAGSGDGSVYLAEQLRAFGGKVTHLDMSEASIGVARRRAEIRQLDNIEFVHASILDIPNMGLGEFDYVTCTGVLHHMASPEGGLKALLAVLKPDGLLKLMVYGQYGRTWVYHMQELMQHINRDVAADDFDTQLENCKQAMKVLHGTRWFTELEKSVNDVKTMGDVGIFDLFLHSQDRAYTVPELYDFVESRGLTFHHYIPAPYTLDPQHLPDSDIKSILLQRDKREQQAIMEMMNGKIKKHFCFVSRSVRTVPSLEDESLIPFFTLMVRDMQEIVHNMANNSAKDRVKIKVGGKQVEFPLNLVRRAVFAAIDNARNIMEVLDEAQHSLGAEAPERVVLKHELTNIYNVFHDSEWMFLRHSTIPRFPEFAVMRDRVKNIYS